MFRLLRQGLILGALVTGSLALLGCGGGGLSGGPTPSVTGTGTVSVQLGDLGKSRLATGATYTAVLWGEGMSNAKQSGPLTPDLANPANNVLTFDQVPEGVKGVRVDAVDSAGHVLEMGFDRGWVAGGTNPTDGQPVVTQFSPLRQTPEVVQGRVVGAADLSALPLPPGAPTPTVSLVSESGILSGENAFFLGTEATGGDLYYFGWQENPDLLLLSGSRAVAQPTSFAMIFVSPSADGTAFFVDPIPVIKAGQGPGYRREVHRHVLALPMTALPVRARQTANLAAVGEVDALVEYLDVHGVSVPAGNFANTSVVSVKVVGASYPNAAVQFSTNSEEIGHYVKGTGPVMWRSLETDGTHVKESLRVLASSGVGALGSATRVPYAIDSSFYPTDPGRDWSWLQVTYSGTLTGSTPTG